MHLLLIKQPLRGEDDEYFENNIMVFQRKLMVLSFDLPNYKKELIQHLLVLVPARPKGWVKYYN
jgi:hypothetical protein